jgi:hypothetical protein
MASLIYDVTNFKGITNAYGATTGGVIQCDNYDATVDSNATSIFHGMLTKFPDRLQFGTTVSTNISRGLYLFAPALFSSSGLYRYIQAFSDGTVRYYNSTLDAWTTIRSGFNQKNPFDFETFLARDTLYFTNGAEYGQKWKANWTTSTNLKDKGRTPVAITGTLTFTTDSTNVTGAASSFTTELAAGSWIRRSSTEPWYEVDSVSSDTALQLTTVFLEGTGAGGAGTSQEAQDFLNKGRFFKIWNDRLFFSSGETGYYLLKEDGDKILLEDGGGILI